MVLLCGVVGFGIVGKACWGAEEEEERWEEGGGAQERARYVRRDGRREGGARKRD